MPGRARTPAEDRGPSEGERLPAAAGRELLLLGVDYSMRRPEMAREITSCWICSVPSKMSKGVGHVDRCNGLSLPRRAAFAMARSGTLRSL
jgi:hypothetical protein